MKAQAPWYRAACCLDLTAAACQVPFGLPYSDPKEKSGAYPESPVGLWFAPRVIGTIGQAPARGFKKLDFALAPLALRKEPQSIRSAKFPRTAAFAVHRM